MPMPPAMNSVWIASRRSGKLLRGSEIASTSPSRTLSCKSSDPPRDNASRLTPIT